MKLFPEDRDEEMSMFLRDSDEESGEDESIAKEEKEPSEKQHPRPSRFQPAKEPKEKKVVIHKKPIRRNKTKVPRVRTLNVTPGVKEVKVTWEIFPKEEFNDIQYIIQWRKKGEQKGWRRGESTKLIYIIKNLAPETAYEVKVAALWERIISPSEQTDVTTDKRESVQELHSLDSPRDSPVEYAQRKLSVIIINDHKGGMHTELNIRAREIFDFFDKTLRFKTVVKLENQPREKVRDWFKALDRSKMFDGFEMFVCVLVGFGDYNGFYGCDGELLSFHEIYKQTREKFGSKPKVILVDIINIPSSRVPSMKSADVRVMENSSREVVLEWTPPRYHESDVQFHIECFKGLNKVMEVFQPNTRIEFENLEPNTHYRFHVTPVLGKEGKPYGSSVYAKIKTKARLKDTDILEVRNLCAQRLSENEILMFWNPPGIRKTSHLSYVISWVDQTNLTKRSEMETKKTSCILNGLQSNSEQLVKVAVKAYDKTFFPLSYHVPYFQDVLRPTHVTAIAESHSVFWVDWQFPIDKQEHIEKFIVHCSECLSFRKNRTRSFDVMKDLRSLPVTYIPELFYHYIKVSPIAQDNSPTVKLHESLIARIETDKALRLFVSSKTSNSCELIWWVDIQDREMVSTYTAHCKPSDPKKKKFKPVPLKLGPECRQTHEIVNLESDTTYFVSIYHQRKMYTQQVKVRTLPKGNPENLEITFVSSFEVIVTWSENFKSGATENTYIVEYKCDPTIMKRTMRLRTSECSIRLTDLLPDVQYEVSVKNKEKGDPSVKTFRTPKFGPTNLQHRVTSSEIALTWESAVLPENSTELLQYHIFLEREDGNRQKGMIIKDTSVSFHCTFGNLWSSTSYVVKCFTLIDGKRKYAPIAIKAKTKSDNLRTLLEPKGDNFIISFASREWKTDALLQTGLYTADLFLTFQENFYSKSVDEMLDNIDMSSEDLKSYTVTNIKYPIDKVMLDTPKADVDDDDLE
ncbi:uncharacterized protein LOC133175650 [Saccostrea echinata]|uniref:uncharacterized protein LOC133175650 n=1 Tax=Saccostrea echinata TaxID=191078 RepID=UPI002A83561A|nr:uncharacterized protein LOC133175650 [Saccostrea echinata]